MNYSTVLKSRPFFFTEQSEVINLVNKGKQEDEIKEMIIEDDILRFSSINRRKDVSSTTLARLEVLDDYLIKNFNKFSILEKKFIVMYTIVKTDLLFFEFMVEVFREKYLSGEEVLKDVTFEHFFRDKALQSERVAGWRDYTYYKLKQVYLRILYEAELINNQDERKILRPVVSNQIIDHIKQRGDTIYLKALLGVI